ncbi:MAG: ATP-binding protein [Bacteroidales bacterium]|nr:ATP-binding protein [Bacteroidales bacterium]
MKKELFKSLILLKQSEIPFNVIERDVELPLNRGKIITIPGVRRCGKSTMMEIAINHLVESGVAKERILWLGFDDERLTDLSVDEFDDIISAYMELYPHISIKDVYMFFDEIQLVEKWEYFVLRLFKSYCKNIYVCGSNATMLSTELASVLRGYPLEFATTTLSFKEYCTFLNIPVATTLEQDKARMRMAFKEFNSSSSFPEVVLTKSKSEQTKILQTYFSTMIMKDLIEHYKTSNIEIVKYFAKRIMTNISKPTSINSIYNDIKSQGLKVSKNDLYLWANYLCGIFLLARIPKYTKSIIKEHNSLDKYYCVDNGLRNAVLLPQSEDDGKLLENNVFQHLNRNLQPFEKITYFKEKYECDFVIQQDELVKQLIQVTWTLHDSATRKREIDGLLEAARSTGCKNLTIITYDEELSFSPDDAHTIKVIPAWKWMLGKSQ